MTVSDQLAYERRVRPRFAVLTFAGAILVVVSQLVQLSGQRSTVGELTISLLLVHQRFPLDLIGAILDGFGFAALALGLGWLAQATKVRSPLQQPFVRWLVLAGGFLAGIMAVVSQIVLTTKANEFVSTGNQSYLEAKRLTSGALLTGPQLLALLGTLLLAAGVVWISLSAMRVGLLPRALGWLGILAGVFFLFPIAGALGPILQGFWLAAVAVVIYGRWPGGDPPAWEAGVSVPWPRAERPPRPEPAREPRRRGGKQKQKAPAPVAVAEEKPASAPSPATSKRKRKRRR